MKRRSLLKTAAGLVLAGSVAAAFSLTAAATAADGKKPKPEKGEKVTPMEAGELNIKAGEVTMVTYQGPAKQQTLTQIDPGRWRGPARVFKEVERDEFSVYLAWVKDEKERVAIDLHTRKVTFYGVSPEVSYPILTVSKAALK